jgi:methyl-accepting chemotaxis protein
LSDVPSATVVQDGKLGGDVPKGGAGGGAGKSRPPYKRKISNYLLDKRLQLRYTLLVTVLSGIISGSLGYLIYEQRHAASESIERQLADDKSFKEVQQVVAAEYAVENRMLLYKMVGVGVGLVVILSLYLVLMTHKVAGPLYKVSMYFDRMAEGRLSNVTALRRGDMLQDFFGNFREMHEAVRKRMQSDVITMESAAVALRAKATADGNKDLVDALDSLDKHITQRKKQLL